MPEVKKGAIIPTPRQVTDPGLPKKTSQTNELQAFQSDVGLLTTNDLNNILEVNQKSLTIYLEVERQNRLILETLKENKETLEIVEEIKRDLEKFNTKLSENEDAVAEIKKKIEEIDKNMFRLILILGSAGVGTIVTIVQALMHK